MRGTRATALGRNGAWLGLAAAGVILACWCWPGPEPRAPESPQGPARQRSQPRVASGATWGARSARPSTQSPAGTALPPRDLSEILAPFDELTRKALPSRQEQRALRTILSDGEAIGRIRDELLYAVGPTFSLPVEQERLRMVSFLQRAIAWRENPARREALESAAQIVSSESYHQHGQDPRLQRSLLGDKRELLVALASSEPALAAKLVDQGLQGKNRPFFHYLLGKAK